jgi:hypothetical protein
VQRTKDELAQYFTIKDMGPVKYLLGWEIRRDRQQRKVHLSQQGYTVKILEKFDMTNCRSASTPLEPGIRLSKSDSAQTTEDKIAMKRYPYATLIGSLMYLTTCTRPDIAYAVGVLCRFMACPGMAHWEAAQRVLRYLKGTADLGLTYGGPRVSNELIGYTDADWGGDEDTSRSTTGSLVTLAGGAVSWASRLQKTVTKSTFAAEYVAASETGDEVQWLRTLLQEIRLPVQSPTTIYIDNSTALLHLTSDMTTQKSKMIRIHYHTVRDYIKEGNMLFVYVPTEAQYADALTKAVSKGIFEGCNAAMGLEST